MKKLSFVIVTIAFFCGSLLAQIPLEQHQRIQTLVESRDYKTAYSELRSLAKANKKSFTVNNYDYLSARLSEKLGDLASANANYSNVVKRNSVLREYALWHLSQIARNSGNLMLERIYLQQLLTLSPKSLLSETATTRISRSYFESQDYQAVINRQSVLTQDVSKANSSTTPNPKTRENLVYLGQSYLQSGQSDKAREIFTNLVTNLPNSAQPDDFALAGAKGLDELDGGKENLGKIAPNIGDPEHLRRALIYQFNRNFADARLHYTAIVEKFPASPNVPDALVQIGRGFAQESRFEEALQWYARLLSQFPDHPVAKDALNFSASAYARVGKAKESINRYKEVIDKYIEGKTGVENAERPYLNIVDAMRDENKDSDALKWVEKTREKFAGQLPATIALFAKLRIYLSQTDWTNSLSALDELQTATDLGGTRVPGGTNKAEVNFLKAYCLEQLGRFPEAFSAYLAIPDGRSEYYGWRATEHLLAMAKDAKTSEMVLQKLNEFRAIAGQNVSAANAEAVRQASQNGLRLTDDQSIRQILLESARKAYEFLPNYKNVPNGTLLKLGRQEILKEKSKQIPANFHQAIADELIFLGLYDEGTPELETALRETGQIASAKNESTAGKPPTVNSNPQILYTLAVFYKRGDMANRAVGYIEPLWRNVPADYLLELAPRESVELLYPIPFADSLLASAPSRNVDPRFALSIMRQESRYRADVKSVAAARGLMQFISTTSNQIAVELGKKNFRQDDLYDPPTAILFGSQYLSNIFRQFPNQPQAVSAAYNGGESNVQRWMNRSNSDNPDRYVCEIVFSQSKDYAYKVLANYRVYQMFYDEKLQKK